MKRLLILIPLLLVGRENPFVLPNASSSSVASRSSFASVVSVASQEAQQSSVASKQKKIVYPFVTLVFKKNGVVILTKNRVQRIFVLDKPLKLVIDISSKKSFSSRRADIDFANFTKLTIGSHKHYYRIAIGLQQMCKAKLTKKKPFGYFVSCEPSSKP